MSNLNKIEELDLNDESGGECYKTYSSSKGTTYDIYLSDNVDSDGFEYTELLNLLRSASHRDSVSIYLANFGGACHSGIKIAHAIRRCAACVVMHVQAPCYSMGAVLAVSGDGLIMEPHTYLMFHNYSTHESGKAGELKCAVHEYEKHFHNTVQYFCAPFLTCKELRNIKEDKDVYVHTSDQDINKRIRRHFK